LKVRTLLPWLVALPGSWYASLAAHEFGHAAVAAATGSTRIDIHLPLLGFSHTQRSPDSHALLTTAAGPVLGSVFPLAVWLLVRGVRPKAARVPQFWAGFALVLNGAYIAGDAFLLGGDGAQLDRAGVPFWLSLTCGSLAVASGLHVWHCLGKTARAATEIASTTIQASLVCAIILLAAGLVAVAAF
jgi:hypothetical protein